jgi:hypothetical protein
MPVELKPSDHKLESLFDYTNIERFYVPEFQRPYAWGVEQCKKLWDDIYSAWRNDYRIPCFLGSIIVYPKFPRDNSKHMYLIDGQQRITTLLLLLRAMCVVVASNIEETNIERYKDQYKDTLRVLRSMLWKPEEPGNKYSEIDTSEARLNRENIEEPSCDIFQVIMETGMIGQIPEAKDNNNGWTIESDYASKQYISKVEMEYNNSKKRGPRRRIDDTLKKILGSNELLNYAYFLTQLYKIPSEDLPRFISLFLSKCYILPLSTGDSQSALLIFDILNNRGIPLTDSDILKNIIASTFKTHDVEFKVQWDKLLDALRFDSSEPKSIQLDSLFRHYMYALRMTRAKDPIDPYAKSKDPELRDYFTTQKHGCIGIDSLKSTEVVFTLTEMASFLVNALSYVANDSELPNDLIGIDARYNISVLNKLKPNGKWQYLISTFWYAYRKLATNNPEQFRIKFTHYIYYATSVILLKSLIEELKDTVIPTICESIAIQAAIENYLEPFSPSFNVSDLINSGDFDKARKVLSIENVTYLDRIDHLGLL